MDWNKINDAYDELSKAISALDGTSWKASKSEVQSQYSEIPFWILIFDESDLAVVHTAFQTEFAKVRDRLEPAQCTLSYVFVGDDEETQIEYFMDNDDILADRTNAPIGEMPTKVGRAKDSMFHPLTSAIGENSA